MAIKTNISAEFHEKGKAALNALVGDGVDTKRFEDQVRAYTQASETRVISNLLLLKMFVALTSGWEASGKELTPESPGAALKLTRDMVRAALDAESFPLQFNGESESFAETLK